MVYPAGINDKQWSAAVVGCLLGSKLPRTDVSCPLFFIVINDKQSWSAAVGGCLLGSRLLHTDVSCPHFFIGLESTCGTR